VICVEWCNFVTGRGIFGLLGRLPAPSAKRLWCVGDHTEKEVLIRITAGKEKAHPPRIGHHHRPDPGSKSGAWCPTALLWDPRYPVSHSHSKLWATDRAHLALAKSPRSARDFAEVADAPKLWRRSAATSLTQRRIEWPYIAALFRRSPPPPRRQFKLVKTGVLRPPPPGCQQATHHEQTMAQPVTKA